MNKLDKILDKKNYYQCPRCGYVLPKQDATISGYDSHIDSAFSMCVMKNLK